MLDIDDMKFSAPCKICRSPAELCGVVDFNRSCEDRSHALLKLSGVPVYYRRCTVCDFVFTSFTDFWEKEALLDKIYNDDYIKVDPEYRTIRPQRTAELFISRFRIGSRSDLSVLDFGGGGGVFAECLRQKSISAQTYDPFVAEHATLPGEKFDVVTCYECIEHTSQPIETARSMVQIVKDRGIIHVTTGILSSPISDSQIMGWWYLAPRNGHVSIFSQKATSIMWSYFGFQVQFIRSNEYVCYRKEGDLKEFLDRVRG